jgi:mono/diheme cytochrome c family protein
VLLRDSSRLALFDVELPGAQKGGSAGRMDGLCFEATAPEPVALALSPDAATLYVTSGWGRALGAYDAQTLAKGFEVALPREPRAVLVSDDGGSAYVAHAVGAHASHVDLRTHAVTEVPLHATDAQREAERKLLKMQLDALAKTKADAPQEIHDMMAQLEKGQPSCQGYALAKSVGPAGRLLLPQTLVDTGDPAQRAPGYGNDQSPTEVSDVAVVVEATGEPFAASLERTAPVGWGEIEAQEAARPECILPRAAAVDPVRRSLLVSCLGIDQVVEYDALAASPARAERQRWDVAAGPNGIAVDAANRRAVVWSQFDRAIDVINLGPGVLGDDRGRPPLPATQIDMAPDPSRRLPAEVALGRLLFHAVDDARISRDGRACASCHPDGRDDSLVWATPSGPRRSIMLAGRVKATAPYAWNGTEEDLTVHLATTFDRLNGSGGLKSVELRALEAYVESLPPPPVAVAESARAQIERGAKLFASRDVGCASCHSGAAATDNARHDVSSKTSADRSGVFNTPTLRFVGGAGPYFHDGRYATLHDLLTSNGDAMGHTKQLSPDDLGALEAYLRTL